MSDPSIIDTVYFDPEDRAKADATTWDDEETYNMYLVPPWSETMRAQLHESPHSPDGSHIITFEDDFDNLGDGYIDLGDHYWFDAEPITADFGDFLVEVEKLIEQSDLSRAEAISALEVAQNQLHDKL